MKPPKLPKRIDQGKRSSEAPARGVNKAIFEQQWASIRSQSTARWSLMADFDLNKVDKAEDKYDKFITLLQVKYGYTRQQAREELNKFWAEHQPQSRNSA